MARSWSELLGDAAGAEETEAERAGFFGRLRDSLGKSRRALTGELADGPGPFGEALEDRPPRRVRKRDMIHNDYAPHMEVDSQTYEVRADGELLTCEPAEVLPMAQRYFGEVGFSEREPRKEFGFS